MVCPTAEGELRLEGARDNSSVSLKQQLQEEGNAGGHPCAPQGKAMEGLGRDRGKPDMSQLSFWFWGAGRIAAFH